MKIILFLCFLLSFGIAKEAAAQISTSQIRSLSKQVKQASSAAKNVVSGAMLSQLDDQLRQKFKLDAVKSVLSGETLSVKAASAAFARLPAASQNAHGARILEGAVSMLGAQKSLPVKTLVVDLVQDINLGNSINRFSRQLK